MSARSLRLGQKNIYDLACVKQLISLLGIYPISSAVVLSDNRCGIVREVPTDNHLLPLVEIIIDATGKLVDTPYLVDLSADSSVQRNGRGVVEIASDKAEDIFRDRVEDDTAAQPTSAHAVASSAVKKAKASPRRTPAEKNEHRLSIVGVIDPHKADKSIHRYLTLDI